MEDSQIRRGTLKSQPPGYAFSTDDYDMFQTIFVSAGELHFESLDPGREATLVLSSGEFLVLRGGSRFRLASPSTGYGGICYLDYRPEDESQFGYSFAFRGGHWLVELVGLLQFALTHPELYRQGTLAALGKSMALHALEEGLAASRSDGSGVSEYWAEQVRQLVQSTLYADQNEYRRKLRSFPLSYRQLSRHFRGSTGMSIKQYHVRERIREAKRLLLNTGFTITDVAHELHYPSSQKFAFQFKQNTGMTPGEFRRLV
jgi:AraC-like DNA-binding protein